MKNILKSTSILISSLIFIGIFNISFANTVNVDSKLAINTFQKDLDNIKNATKSKKLDVNQAQVLLSAIIVRQNNVLIAQNQELITLLHEKNLTKNQ